MRELKLLYERIAIYYKLNILISEFSIRQIL